MKLQSWQTQITPIGDNVCCVPIEGPKETPGGLALPDRSATSGPCVKAQVFAVGPGAVLPGGDCKEMEVGVGDIVWFVKAGSYQETIDEGHEIWTVSERDILYVVHEVVDGPTMEGVL